MCCCNVLKLSYKYKIFLSFCLIKRQDWVFFTKSLILVLYFTDIIILYDFKKKYNKLAML